VHIYQQIHNKGITLAMLCDLYYTHCIKTFSRNDMSNIQRYIHIHHIVVKCQAN